MILHINTIKDEANKIEIKISKDGKVLATEVKSARAQQAEKLIPAIADILAAKKISLNKIKKIEVANYGGSFTALRIGVTTANALGYALSIPVEGTKKLELKPIDFSIVEPIYNKNPDITISQKKLVEK